MVCREEILRLPVENAKKSLYPSEVRSIPSPPAAVGRENCFLRMSRCALNLSYACISVSCTHETHAPARAGHTDIYQVGQFCTVL